MELVFLSGEISLVGLPSGLISPTFFSTKADQCFLKILDTFFYLSCWLSNCAKTNQIKSCNQKQVLIFHLLCHFHVLAFLNSVSSVRPKMSKIITKQKQAETQASSKSLK